jgi:TonB family protein
MRMIRTGGSSILALAFAVICSAPTTITAHLKDEKDGLHIVVGEQHDRGSMAFLYLTNGKKFDCDFSCEITFRFDGGDTEGWKAASMELQGALGVQLARVDKLIAALQSAHHVDIEATLLSAEKGSFSFDVESLVWPPAASSFIVKTGNAPSATTYRTSGGAFPFIHPPNCYKTPNPRIPKGYRKPGSKVVVTARATITAQGVVEDIKVLKSPDPAFNEEIEKTLPNWKCNAATMIDGEPVPSIVMFEVNFHQD